MLKARVPIIPKKSIGSYRISFDLLYHGELEMGRPNGQGQVISLLTNDVQYEGEVIDSIYNGKGCRYCKGVLYEEGTFDKGLIVEGVRYNSNGTVYSGYFENNVYHGNGRIVLPNGFFVSGSFSKGSLRDKDYQAITISIPSAKQPTQITKDTQNIEVHVKEEFIQVTRPEYRGISFIFYSNGDVFVGVMEDGSKRGYFYRYAETSFERMILDNVKGIPTIHPIITIEAGKQYKSFSMSV